jgi:hypothetical protein
MVDIVLMILIWWMSGVLHNSFIVTDCKLNNKAEIKSILLAPVNINCQVVQQEKP